MKKYEKMFFFHSKSQNSKLKNLIKSPNWQVADKLYFTSTVEQSVNLKLAGNKTSRWSGAQIQDVRISSTRY